MINRRPSSECVALSSDGTNWLSKYLIGRIWGALAGERDRNRSWESHRPRWPFWSPARGELEVSVPLYPMQGPQWSLGRWAQRREKIVCGEN